MQKLSRYKKALVQGEEFIKKGLISKKPMVAYVGGWLGRQNLGDEALFEAAKLLFNRFDLFHFNGSRTQTCLSMCFPFTKTGILAGGTLINQLEDWLQIVRKHYKGCNRMFVFGTGVANPSFWASRPHRTDIMDKWKPLLEECQYVGVRGPMSAELLTNAGIHNVEVIGDPAITFAENEINSSYIPNSIGLNVGQSYGQVWGDENTICSEFIKLAKLARKAKWSVYWFVVFPEDLEIAHTAANASGTSDNIYEIFNDPKKYIELVKPLSTFVGMKLHATILASCAFVPSIMLEYRPKCRDYMRSIGQDTATFRTDKFRAEIIWELVSSWNSQRHEKAETLFKAIKPLQQKQRQRAEKLMNEICVGI